MRACHLIPALAFAFLIVYRPSLGPIDDHLFLKPFHWLQLWFNDRFFILDGIEQFMINNAFGISPVLFFLVNAIEFMVLFWLLDRITKNASSNGPSWIGWIPVLAIMTPGLSTAYLRLLVPERLLVLCLSGIVYLDLTGYKTIARKVIYIGLALIGFLLKEPTFLIIAGIAFFNFLKKKERGFQVIMAMLSIAYLFLYLYLTRVVAPASSQYGAVSIKGFSLFAKNLYNFALNDPLVFFVVVPVFFVSLKRKAIDPYTTIISGYTLLFMVLGIYQEYYLLPMLPFLVVVICRIWKSIPKFHRVFVTILFINSSLYGLGQISIYKNEPRGFLKTIEWLGTLNIDSSKKVCFLGLNIQFSSEILFASKEFFRHLSPNQPLPVFSSTTESPSGECVVWIQSPYNYNGDKPGQDAMLSFEQKSSFWIPQISLKPLIKRVVLSLGSERLVNENINRNHDWAVYR